MFQAAKFKSIPSSDNFKHKVYEFDKYLEQAIKTFVANLNTQEIQKQYSHYNLTHLHDTVNSVDLTKKVLELENIKNISVSKNNLQRTSNCSFNRITFCGGHIFNQEVAFHEMAHLFEGFYAVNNLPDHHVSFLATLEFLLDKYHFLNKSTFKLMVNKYNEISGNSIPYIENFFNITEHNLSDYESILNSLNTDVHYSEYKSNKFFRCSNFERVIFETNHHYVTLLVNKFNTNTFQKIIQKKLDFEIKKDKYYDLIISPKFTAYRDYGRIHLSTSKHNYTHDAFAISIESEHFDSYLLIDLIEQQLKFNSNNGFSIHRQNDKVILIAVYSDHNNGDNNLISRLSDLFKSKNISYYKTKSKNDFSNKSTRTNHFIF